MKKILEAKVAVPVVIVLMLLPLLISVSGLMASPEVSRAPTSERPLDHGEQGGGTSDSLFGLVARRAPFRVAGSRSSVRFDPLIGDPQYVPPPAPPRPPLQLSGLVSGGRPGAIIDGIPGQQGGVLLYEGDTIAGLRVRRITSDKVTIIGPDTVWVLSVRSPW